MRVTVEVDGRRFDEDLAAQAVIPPDLGGLNEALEKCPARYAEWAMLEAAARERYEAAVAVASVAAEDLKDLEAALLLEVAARGAKMTVDQQKAAVTVHPRRVEALKRRRVFEDAAREAKADLEKVAVGRRTMDLKKDALIARAANWRQEMSTQLSVRTQQFRPGARVED